MTLHFDIATELRNKMPQSSKDLMARLRVSRPSLAQRLESNPDIVRIGHGQRRRYALRAGEPVAIYRTDATGKARLMGMLTPLTLGWYFDAQNEPVLTQGDFRDGYYPDLPWFIQDLRPQGFLGRAFARRVATELGFLQDPERWTGAQLVQALSLYGNDLTGDITISQAALVRTLQNQNTAQQCIAIAERKIAFARLAERAMQDGTAGSSAAGEQPKFCVSLQWPNSDVAHAVVKFSSNAATAEAQRWRDLLRCEHWAAVALRESGLGAAETEIIEADGRVFLQSIRYDRVGMHGRRRQFSLGVYDDAFFGFRDNWFDAARRLHTQQLLTAADATRLQAIYAFGLAIRNTDMHFGNMSLIDGDQAPLALAPTYDMLPMQFRPNAAGELNTGAITPTIQLPEHAEVHAKALPAVQRFCELVMADQAITLNFRAVLNKAILP